MPEAWSQHVFMLTCQWAVQRLQWILPSMSWVSSADVAFAITSRCGTTAIGVQWDKYTPHKYKTHFAHYDGLLMKHLLNYLNSCFISCAIKSDATESKEPEESTIQNKFHIQAVPRKDFFLELPYKVTKTKKEYKEWFLILLQRSKHWFSK